MYSDFYEIPLPALRFEKVEETDTKKWKKRHRRETTPFKFDLVKKPREKTMLTTLKGKQIHSHENDMQRRLKNASKKQKHLL